MRTIRASGLQTMTCMMLGQMGDPGVACGLPLDGVHPDVLTALSLELTQGGNWLSKEPEH